MSEKKPEEKQPIDWKKIGAIDCSIFPGYCTPVDPEKAKARFEIFEMKVMAYTTFSGVFKRMGLKPGEEWKVLTSGTKGSVEAMLAEMDEAGVEKVAIIGNKFWSQHDHKLISDISVDEVHEIMKKGKGRVIGAGGYNPFRIKESLQDLERGVKEFGFKYVWTHPISFGMRPDDRRNYPLYYKCLEWDIAVGMQVGHSAEILTSEPGHPMTADNIAIEFPDLRIILTHTGYPWIDEWCSMLWRHPNVYGMINAYFPSGLQPVTIQFMDSPRGRDKIMWGSHGFGISRWVDEFIQLPISDATKKNVLRDNAVKALKL
jgi:predicted TIM-barrel fold metal-dependent hydrolase